MLLGGGKPYVFEQSTASFRFLLGFVQKCDGTKPTCRSCRMAGRLQECEYTDRVPAMTSFLEDEVTKLEARINDLEQPRDNMAHNPHAADFQAQSRRTSRSDGRPNDRRKSLL